MFRRWERVKICADAGSLALHRKTIEEKDMSRFRIDRLLVVSVIGFLLSACASAATEPPTSAPTVPLSTQPLSTQPPPSPTSVPPTSAPGASPTPAAAEATIAPPTLAPAANPIARLAAGQPVTITTIHMLDANTGWATGGAAIVGDHVLHTADGGNTWKDVTPPEPASAPESPSRAIGFFMDTNTAWVAYNYFNVGGAAAAGTVWRTADGGQTWQASALINWADAGDYFDPTDMQFLDAQNGWLLVHLGVGMSHDYVALFHTTDGGLNWERTVDPLLNNLQMSCEKTGMVFVDSQTGWVTGDCHGVAPGVFLQTTRDGGQTWQTPELPPPADQPDLFKQDTVGCGTYDPAPHGLVVRCVHFTEDPIRTESFLYTTADGGQTWQPLSLPIASASVTFLNPNVGWATGTPDPNNPTASRDIYQTSDGGKTWARAGTVAWSGAFDFVTEQQGWAIAQAGEALALVATTNGGRKWQLISAQISP